MNSLGAEPTFQITGYLLQQGYFPVRVLMRPLAGFGSLSRPAVYEQSWDVRSRSTSRSQRFDHLRAVNAPTFNIQQSTTTCMFFRRRLFLDAFRASSRITCRPSSTVSTNTKPYYITTPIFYPNASSYPHRSLSPSRTENQRSCSTTHWTHVYSRDCGYFCPVQQAVEREPTSSVRHRDGRAWVEDPKGRPRRLL